jgi:predicted transcriptional regulator
MGIMASDIRQELHALAERLPEDAGWADVMELLRYREAVAEGLAAADRGEFARDEEVRRVFAKYGVKV